jgi:hypothetical protein
MLLDDCGEFLAKKFPRYALVLRNGVILKSVLEEKLLLKIIPYMLPIAPTIQMGEFYQKPPLVIFHATEHVFIVLISRVSETVLNTQLKLFQKKFADQLTSRYSTLIKNVGDLFQFNFCALSRNAGPEPVGWVINNNGQLIHEEEIWKLAITVMMLLMNEVKGVKERILTFHTFIEGQQIGCIYYFQIPHERARGGSLDAALVAMGYYEHRAIFYENHDKIERIFQVTADEITACFQKDYRKDSEAPIQTKQEFNKILNKLSQRLLGIPIKPKSSEDIKENMLDSLRDALNALNMK